jgi:hypothetical protein
LAWSAFSDLDDGWCRLLHDSDLARDDASDVEWDSEEAAVLATAHPGLANALADLGLGSVTFGLAADGVAVAPLTGRAQRRLARRARHIPPQHVVRWTTFGEAPGPWWVRRAAEDARAIRGSVARLLARDPADDTEVVEVIQHRGAEILSAEYDLDPAALTGEAAGMDEWAASIVATLVEDVLLRQGWRLEHPVIRHVLIGPAGERLDGNRLAKAALDQPDAAAELRAILTRDAV